jgi:CRISPR-associated protein Csm3
MVFNVYDPEDKILLKSLFEAMCLLEDDYLGGQGSRGYGRIKFADVKMDWRSREYYLNGDKADEKKGFNNDHRTPKEIKQNFDQIVKEIEIGTAG